MILFVGDNSGFLFIKRKIAEGITYLRFISNTLFSTFSLTRKISFNRNLYIQQRLATDNLFVLDLLFIRKNIKRYLYDSFSIFISFFDRNRIFFRSLRNVLLSTDTAWGYFPGIITIILIDTFQLFSSSPQREIIFSRFISSFVNIFSFYFISYITTHIRFVADTLISTSTSFFYRTKHIFLTSFHTALSALERKKHSFRTLNDTLRPLFIPIKKLRRFQRNLQLDIAFSTDKLFIQIPRVIHAHIQDFLYSTFFTKRIKPRNFFYSPQHLLSSTDTVSYRKGQIIFIFLSSSLNSSDRAQI